MEIPKRFQLGAQEVEVSFPEKMDKLGECALFAGYLKIAKTYNGYEQTKSSQFNTFVHELVHLVLDTMGKGDLSQDEVFVSSFSGYLADALNSMED